MQMQSAASIDFLLLLGAIGVNCSFDFIDVERLQYWTKKPDSVAAGLELASLG